MAVNTQPNVSLLLKIKTTSVECQIIDLSFSPPGVGASTVTETACPSGIVSEPGATQSGTLTGNAFTDALSTGLAWLLASAWEVNETMAFELTFHPELGPTKSMKYTGTCRCASFTLDFAKPGIGKHPIDLEVMTADLVRGVELVV